MFRGRWRPVIKSVAVVTCSLIMTGLLPAAAGSRLLAKYVRFQPSGEYLKGLWGPPNFGYGGELNISLNNWLDVWAGGLYYSKQINVSNSQNVKSLLLVPLDAGLKLKLPFLSIATPYIGAGISHCIYKESGPDGQVSNSGFGYCVQGGFVFPSCTQKSCISSLLSVDLFINYSDCRVIRRHKEVDFGGLRLGVGWGFSF